MVSLGMVATMRQNKLLQILSAKETKMVMKSLKRRKSLRYFQDTSTSLRLSARKRCTGMRFLVLVLI